MIQTHTNSSPRLLIPTTSIGALIGRSGAQIKNIQSKTNCRIVISKDLLPGSDERSVEISGAVDDVRLAVYIVCTVCVSGFGPAVSPYDPRIEVVGK